MNFTPPEVIGKGRNFNCATCKSSVKKMRRCGIEGGPDRDRWDFTADDNPSIFPIYLYKGGQPYNFCPAKVTWDYEANSIFKLLMIAAETGQMLCVGGIIDQPNWFIDLLGWFLPMYDRNKFLTKAQSILGTSDGKKPKAKTKK